MAAHWPLVAREPQLSAFAEAWAVPGLQTVMIWGPAGVGKTRLAEELLGHAVDHGYQASRATATAAASAVPLGALAHLIPPGIDLGDPVAGFAEVARVLGGPERRRVLHIDDLHLLDAASAVLVRQLMDADLVRLIATVRSGEPVSSAVQALSQADRTHRLDLAEFDVPQVEELLTAALGGPVAGRTVHALFAASGGNALYLRELTFGALADGSLAHDGEIWQLDETRRAGTPRLTDLINARLAAAPGSARPVLELVALCEPLPLSDAEALAGTDVLAEVEGAGLITVTRLRQRTSLRLAHPLYGEILRAQLPELRRRELLLAQIERTRARGGQRQDDARRITTWQLAATGSADPADLVAAARLARYAHDNRQTIAMLDALPDRSHGTLTRLMLGEALQEEGHAERAESAFRAAESAAATEREALAVVLARTYRLLWSAAGTDEAIAWNEAARRHVTSAAGLAALRHLAGAARIITGDMAGGLALLDDLPGRPADDADGAAWLTSVMSKTIALAFTGRVREAMATAQQAHAGQLRIAESAAGDQSAVLPRPEATSALLLYSLILSAQGRLTEARAVGEQYYGELAADDMPVARAWTSVNLGWIEWLAGRPVSGRRWYAEAAAMTRAHGNVRLTRSMLSGLAACAALVGDFDGAEKALAEAREYEPSGFTFGWESLGQAWLAAAGGDLGAARAAMAEAAEQARSAGLLHGEALALTEIARLGGAQEVAGRLAELAADCGGELVPAIAAWAGALACADAAQLVAAAEDLHRLGADLMAAEAATAAAAAWRRAGLARNATAATRLAEDCAAKCEGARTPLLADAEPASSLTRRQRDIALLAANGAASRDIAEALHLSVHTVNNHLQNIYTRLGVTNRRELADVLGVGNRPALTGE